VEKGGHGIVSYQKLFDIMAIRNIKKIDLRTKYGLHSATVNRLVNNKSVNIEVIAILCDALRCQPGDILEFIDNNGKKPNLNSRDKTAVKEKRGEK
jgi:DNA-binding Xre family transcriptional regulator